MGLCILNLSKRILIKVFYQMLNFWHVPLQSAKHKSILTFGGFLGSWCGGVRSQEDRLARLERSMGVGWGVREGGVGWGVRVGVWEVEGGAATAPSSGNEGNVGTYKTESSSISITLQCLQFIQQYYRMFN